jgi:FMN phosphatase YigB (HAD superfamily)
MSASEGSAEASAGVLVLDFDGTVCLGDGPVWAYADAILPHLDERLAQQVSDGLLAYLEDHPGADTYVDGYGAVAALAGPHVPAGVLDAAYAASRLALAEGRLDIHAPAGLVELLDRLRPSVRAVVMTNAPRTGLGEALDALGLTGAVDEVIASAGKPAGSRPVLQELLAGDPPATLMSVGDIWVNDIQPALELGCVTGFIDRSGRDLRPAHARGRTIQELYPAIEAWAQAARTPHDIAAALAAASDPVPTDS